MEIFWSCFGTFRDMAKSRKFAWRVGESTKIEGWDDHTWRQIQENNASRTGPKTEAQKHPKIEPTLMPHGANIESNSHPKMNVFLARFSDAFENIGGTAREPRRGASTGPRV